MTAITSDSVTKTVSVLSKSEQRQRSSKSEQRQRLSKSEQRQSSSKSEQRQSSFEIDHHSLVDEDADSTIIVDY